MIRVGLPVIIRVDTLPGKVFTGKVDYISSVVDAQSAFMNPDLKVYATQVVLDNDQDLSQIRSGQSCTAEIVVAQYKEATYIPVQAVLNVDGQQTVYVVDRRDLKPRAVTAGLDNGIVIKIDEGLKAGEVVALNPPMQDAKSTDQSFEQLSTVVAATDETQAQEAGGGDNVQAAEGRGNSDQQGSSQQGSGQNRSGGGDFMSMDTDGDGQVSSSEWQGPENAFSRFDANGDGYISEDEAPTGRSDRSGSSDSSGQGQMPSGGFPSDGQMPSRGQNDGQSSSGGFPSNGQMPSSGQMSGFGGGGGAQ
jgi:hypothetical protein